MYIQFYMYLFKQKSIHVESHKFLFFFRFFFIFKKQIFQNVYIYEIYREKTDIYTVYSMCIYRSNIYVYIYGDNIADFLERYVRVSLAKRMTRSRW